jgi:hypothetical protein
VSAGAALSSSDPQPAGAEPFDEFTHPDWSCSGCKQVVVAASWNIVVIEIEASSRHSVGRRERVQFVERDIADQVRPGGAVRRPPRLIDEHRHG